MNIQEENELAKQYGFEITPDKGRGGGWGKFHKGSIHIWRGSWSHPWIRATCINWKYSDHHYMQSLEDAFANKNSKLLKID